MKGVIRGAILSTSPSMQKWQCPIHNRTLKSLIKYYKFISMFITLVSLQKFLRICTAGKHLGIIGIKHFLP